MNTGIATDERYKYGIRYKFSGSIGPLEDWISSNIKGGFSYDLADVHKTDSAFGQLEIIFRFATSADREIFKRKAMSNPSW